MPLKNVSLALFSFSPPQIGTGSAGAATLKNALRDIYIYIGRERERCYNRSRLAKSCLHWGLGKDKFSLLSPCLHFCEGNAFCNDAGLELSWSLPLGPEQVIERAQVSGHVQPRQGSETARQQ